MSEFFRTNKNPDNPFVMMDKRPVENRELSWSAKGLLSYLLSRPEGWKIIMQDLINRSTDKERAVRTIVKELVDAGHMVRRDVRDEQGRFVEHVYDVYEVPTLLFSTSGQSTSGERSTNNTDISNKEYKLADEGKTPSLPLSIENAIAVGAKIESVADDKHRQMIDSANLIATGCGTMQKDVYNLAYTFMKERNIVIPLEDAKGNRKAAKSMVQQGVKPEHIALALEKLQGMTVVDLFGIQKTAVAIANPAPESDNSSKFDW